FENSIKSTLTILFSSFIAILKLVSSLDIISFSILVSSIIVLVLLFVFSKYSFDKKKKEKEENQKLQITFKNLERIELFKLQQSLIIELSKSGFEYKSYFTLKEYLEDISSKKPYLKSDLDKIIEVFYSKRYRDLPTLDDIKLCKSLVEDLNRKINQEIKV
ncbi:MAG: hypothetical protein ACK4IX_05745, partial [Candidatus Sericytochromatia bacterium]